MSGSIVRANPKGAVSTASEAVQGVVKSSKVDYGGTGVFLSDFSALLPDEDANPSAVVIANGMTQNDNKSAVRRGPLYFQRKQGWQATVEGLTVWTFLRPLERQPSGVMKPSGNWFVDSTKKYRYTKVPTRRHGVVPYDRDRIIEDGEAFGGVNSPSVVQGQELHPGALAYLPSVVQRYAISQVPSPTFHQGEIWQWTTSQGNPFKQTLEAIRMNEEVAVVITAFKEVSSRKLAPEEAANVLAQTPWTVTQSVLNLAAANHFAEISR